MPLVRISLLRGKDAGYLRRLGDAIHGALVETIGVPAADRFQLVTQHAPEEFVYDPSYLGIARSPDLVILQITLSAGRTLAQKRSLYRNIARRLHEAVALGPGDAWINLVEVGKEDWSFGLGTASYAPEERAAAGEPA